MPTSKSKLPLPKTAFLNVGVYGEPTIDSFSNEERRVDDLTIVDYRRMIDNDGQLQMLWNAISNAILSVGVTIKDDEDWNNIESSPEREFVKRNLTASRYKGGMSRSLDLTNKTMLRAFIEAYRVFEVVYRVGDDGMIYLDKLAPRAGKTDSEMKLLVNDNGDFYGFKQTTNFKGKQVDVIVVNESDEIIKVVKSTFGEEFGSNYGRSGLKAAWYHYDKAHKGMHLNQVGHELGTVKAKWLKPKTGDEDRIKNAVNLLTRVHMESTVAFPEDDFELELLELSDPAVMQAGLEMIRFHYSTMAKSVLAQFIDLGSNVGDTGSRALGESQVDFFKQNLQSIARILIENPWNAVISSLCKINFGSDIYPTLSVNPIDNKTALFLLDSFAELIRKDKTTETINAKIMGNVSDQLGIDVTEEDIVKEMEEKEVKKEEQKKQEIENQKQMAEMQKKEVVRESRKDISMADDPLMDVFPVQVEPSRELYKDELKVKIVDIKRVFEEKRAEMERVLTSKLNKQKENIIDAYLEASRNGMKSISTVKIELQDGELDYSDEVLRQAYDLLEFGKITSANELEKPVPNTLGKIRKGVETEIKLTIDKQAGDLEYRLQMIAIDGLNQGLPENTVRLMLEQEYDNYWMSKIKPMVQMVESKMFNRGRAITFEKYNADIFGYRYTAVLDSKTTEFCRHLDGTVFQYNDPDFAMYTPPNHYGCRSFWTPIKISESDGVMVSGAPLGLPKFSSVNTFRDLSDDDTVDLMMSEKERRINLVLDAIEKEESDKS